MSDFSDNECEIETDFNKAASYVEKVHKELGSGELLALYGLFKQSTSGPCNTPKPGIFSAAARSKWYAWSALGTMDKSTAMQSYTNKLTELVPAWRKASANKASWVVQSMPVATEDSVLTPEEKTAFDHVKEGNLAGLKNVWSIDDLNALDDEGLGLIHWAADRNANDILDYLLANGSHVNLQDSDKQTALHYASSCGHLASLEVLLKYNADREIRDNECQTCLDVAFDDTVRNLLRS